MKHSRNSTRFAVTLLCVVCPLNAQGQAADGSTEATESCDRARALGRSARTHLQQGDPAVSRDLLQRAVTLCPSVPLRYNLALALRATGAPTEAQALLTQLSAVSLTEQEREAVERLEALVISQASSLQIKFTNAEEGTVASGTVNIEVDGVPEGAFEASETVTLTVDPGSHRIRGRTDMSEGSVNVQLSAGTTEMVTLPLTRFEDDDDDTWVWIGVVGGVVAAGTTAAVVLLTTSDAPWPGDDVTGVTATLLSF